MADIVQVLRDYAALSNTIAGKPVDAPTRSGQAADEIERLRELVAAQRSLIGIYESGGKTLDQVQAETDTRERNS